MPSGRDKALTTIPRKSAGRHRRTHRETTDTTKENATTGHKESTKTSNRNGTDAQRKERTGNNCHEKNPQKERKKLKKHRQAHCPPTRTILPQTEKKCKFFLKKTQAKARKKAQKKHKKKSKATSTAQASTQASKQQRTQNSTQRTAQRTRGRTEPAHAETCPTGASKEKAKRTPREGRTEKTGRKHQRTVFCLLTVFVFSLSLRCAKRSALNSCIFFLSFFLIVCQRQ